MERSHKISLFDINAKTHFEDLYKKYFTRFVRYAYYYVNDIPTAEDITHDALLYFYEHQENLNLYDADALNYIMKSVKNACLNYLKHLKFESNLSQRPNNDLQEWEVSIRIQTLEDKGYDDIFTNDMMDIVRKSLEELPEQTRHIFVMNHFNNKSRKEIAKELGVSVQTIDYHINKATEFLRIKLKDYLPLLLFLLN